MTLAEKLIQTEPGHMASILTRLLCEHEHDLDRWDTESRKSPDYGWKANLRAVRDFLEARGLDELMEQLEKEKKEHQWLFELLKRRSV